MTWNSKYRVEKQKTKNTETQKNQDTERRKFSFTKEYVQIADLN